MMLARDEIVAALESDLPAGVMVIPYARNIDPPSKSTVMVRIDKLRPSSKAGGLWEVEGALVVIAAKTTPGAADDELEALVQDVLYTLQRETVAKALSWTEATRAVYGEPEPTNHAFEVAVTTHIIKEQ